MQYTIEQILAHSKVVGFEVEKDDREDDGIYIEGSYKFKHKGAERDEWNILEFHYADWHEMFEFDLHLFTDEYEEEIFEISTEMFMGLTEEVVTTKIIPLLRERVEAGITLRVNLQKIFR